VSETSFIARGGTIIGGTSWQSFYFSDVGWVVILTPWLLWGWVGTKDGSDALETIPCPC